MWDRKYNIFGKLMFANLSYDLVRESITFFANKINLFILTFTFSCVENFTTTLLHILVDLENSHSVWPDFVKFRQFGKSFQVFVNFLTVYFLFGKMLSLLWQNYDSIGLFLIV